MVVTITTVWKSACRSAFSTSPATPPIAASVSASPSPVNSSPASPAPTTAVASRYDRNSSLSNSRSGSPSRAYQNSAKFVPATIMNPITAHWIAGENASTLRASGENPPVWSVVNPWATAL